MTGKEFLNAVSNGEEDVLQSFLDALEEREVGYCVIGGLAVNAYAEPVVSMDLDIVVQLDEIDPLCEHLQNEFSIKRFDHSINLTSSQSDLRIQLQIDPVYQAFIEKAETHRVLGYEMKVARIEDVLQGKALAFQDETRRKSKRQKDLADIMRLVEVDPSLANQLPDSISDKL